MHAFRFAAFAIAFAGLLSACETTPKATFRSNYDKSANFDLYHTYGFVSKPGTDRAGYSTLLTKHFEDAIKREMDARGYTFSETDPDLFVNFNANAHEKVDVQTTPGMSGPYYGGGYYGYRGGFYGGYPGYAYGPEVSTVRYKVGTANIDVVDARKKQLIWEGLAEGRLTDKIMENPEAAISSLVTQLFAQYPGRATPP
jgi:Domain of unknown function (DUF4136)